MRPTEGDVLRWSEALAGIARTGLGFTQSLYERERFQEILHVAADMQVVAGLVPDGSEAPEVVEGWAATVGDGVSGYVTPKVAVGAVVGNDTGKLLLVQRADSGVWLYPTGWADVGWFAEDELPEPLAGADHWRRAAFGAIRGEPVEVLWDRPRRPVWRGAGSSEEG